MIVCVVFCPHEESEPVNRRGCQLSRDNNIQDTGYRIQDIGYRIQDTGYRIQDTGYRIQDTGYRIQDII